VTCKNMVKKQDGRSNLRYDLKIGQQGEGTFIYTVNNSYLLAVQSHVSPSCQGGREMSLLPVCACVYLKNQCCLKKKDGDTGRICACQVALVMSDSLPPYGL